MLRILEGKNNLPGKPRVDLLDPVNIHQGRSVDAQKARGIKPVLKLCNALIHAVTMAIHHCISQLVVSYEMSYFIQIEK